MGDLKSFFSLTCFVKKKPTPRLSSASQPHLPYIIFYEFIPFALFSCTWWVDLLYWVCMAWLLVAGETQRWLLSEAEESEWVAFVCAWQLARVTPWHLLIWILLMPQKMCVSFPLCPNMPHMVNSCVSRIEDNVLHHYNIQFCCIWTSAFLLMPWPGLSVSCWKGDVLWNTKTLQLLS